MTSAYYYTSIITISKSFNLLKNLQLFPFMRYLAGKYRIYVRKSVVLSRSFTCGMQTQKSALSAVERVRFTFLYSAKEALIPVRSAKHIKRDVKLNALFAAACDLDRSPLDDALNHSVHFALRWDIEFHPIPYG